MLLVNVLAVEEQLPVEELLGNVPEKIFVQHSHSIPLLKKEYIMKIIMNIITKSLLLL